MPRLSGHSIPVSRFTWVFLTTKAFFKIGSSRKLCIRYPSLGSL